jgi:arylsulfatase A
VPLIANWPGYIKADSSDDALVDFSDWLSTLAELGVAKVGHKIDGISFAPALFGLSGSKWKVRSFAFSESKGGKAWVRTQRYKLYNNGQLYDVQKDAMEKKPLKNVAGPLVGKHAALRAAFIKLNYPNKKK